MTQAHNFITKMRQAWDDRLELVPPGQEDANQAAVEAKAEKKQQVSHLEPEAYWWVFPDGSRAIIAADGTTITAQRDYLKQQPKAS